MAKYLLKRGISRLPIDGVRLIPREGLPPLPQGETVMFVAGEVVDTDLDFGPWIEDGTVVRIREAGDPPRPPKPEPVETPKQQILTPMPAFVQAEVVVEPGAAEPATEPAAETGESDARPTRRGRR
jgi:hypothetical protein